MKGKVIALFVVLLGGVVGLQAVHERRGGPPASTSVNMLYVRSPEAMKRMALSYDALLADTYWIRAVQHFGSTKRSNNPNNRYDLLYPLLDLTTSLDPHFNVPYQFGAIFLSEAPPGGPGRPDLAIALLEKGLEAQPERWEFAQAIGFVHYWSRQDYPEAAAWFARAAEFPGAPNWMAPLAATTLAVGGRRDSSRQLWQQVAESEDAGDWFRREAERRLQQLDAMDQMDELQRVVAAYEGRAGRQASGWDDLRRGGYMRGSPIDPTGAPYQLRAGTVSLAPQSRLNPLPAARGTNHGPSMTPFLIIACGLFGLLIGSFLNVCIYRLPLQASVTWPASHCTSCQRPLSWFENVPVVSWLVLRGRCRTCRASIPAMYPLVELTTALVFAGGAAIYGLSALLAVRLAFACALIVLFAIDLRHRILPNVITLPGIGVGFVVSWFLPPGWISSLLGILAGGGVLLGIAEAYRRVRGQDGLGMGDVKMLAMIGAFLGWPLMVLTLVFASFTGSIVGVGLMASGRGDMQAALPFGTFLAVGALVAAVAGDPILAWYLAFYP